MMNVMIISCIDNDSERRWRSECMVEGRQNVNRKSRYVVRTIPDSRVALYSTIIDRPQYGK